MPSSSIMSVPIKQMTNLHKNLKSILQLILTEIHDTSNNNYNAVIIDSYQIKPAISSGENYCGKLERIHVNYTYQSNRKTKSFIVKSLPDGDYCQRYVTATNMFERETKFYYEIISMFKEIDKNFQITPNIYLKDHETSNIPYLFMDDLKEQNFETAPRHNQLDMEHSEIALNQLAKLHALSYLVNKNNENIIAQNFAEGLYCDKNSDIVRNFMEHSFRTLTDTVAKWPEGRYYAEKMSKLNIYEKVHEIVRNEDDSCAFNVLNHGDFWINNILFKYDNQTERPNDCRIIDFQNCRFTSPVLDILCFIHTSVKNVNDLVIDQLLCCYYKTLMAHLEKFDNISDLHSVYNFEHLQNDMKRKIFYGFFSTCSILSAVIAETKNRIDLTELSEENIQISNNLGNPLAKIYDGQKFKLLFLEKLKYFDHNEVLD